MVAKIEFMQSRSIVISEPDQRFLDGFKAKLLTKETEISTRELSRYERILGQDETHRVHAVRAGDDHFARGLNFMETDRRECAPARQPPHDPFADIGKTVRVSRPKRKTVTGQMMAEVEIWQDRIADVAPGQPVEIVADALGRSLRGAVESIGLTVGRQGLISDDAAANSDARVIRVLVALDAESSGPAARYTNLEAVARIDTGAAARVAP